MKKRELTTEIVFHHSLSGDVSADEIRRWHLQKGWEDIGYHYVVRANGDIEHGRPVECVGAHQLHNNLDTIGVCLTGDFTKHKPTPAQISACRELYRQLSASYKGIEIASHRKGDNACPGPLLNREYFVSELTK